MLNDEVRETEQAFGRLKKISGGIRLFLIALAGLMAILLVVKLWAAFAALAESISGGDLVPGIASVAFVAFTDLIVIACLLIGASVFSALKQGDDPFSKRQVRIIRIAALLLLLDVLAGAFASVGMPWAVQFGQTYIGSSPSFGDVGLVVNVNVGELVIAGILIGLSVIFDYARLLQQLSDETL